MTADRYDRTSRFYDLYDLPRDLLGGVRRRRRRLLVGADWCRAQVPPRGRGWGSSTGAVTVVTVSPRTSTQPNFIQHPAQPFHMRPQPSQMCSPSPTTPLSSPSLIMSIYLNGVSTTQALAQSLAAVGDEVWATSADGVMHSTDRGASDDPLDGAPLLGRYGALVTRRLQPWPASRRTLRRGLHRSGLVAAGRAAHASVGGSRVLRRAVPHRGSVRFRARRGSMHREAMPPNVLLSAVVEGRPRPRGRGPVGTRRRRLSQ